MTSRRCVNTRAAEFYYSHNASEIRGLYWWEFPLTAELIIRISSRLHSLGMNTSDIVPGKIAILLYNGEWMIILKELDLM